MHLIVKFLLWKLAQSSCIVDVSLLLEELVVIISDSQLLVMRLLLECLNNADSKNADSWPPRMRFCIIGLGLRNLPLTQCSSWFSYRRVMDHLLKTAGWEGWPGERTVFYLLGLIYSRFVCFCPLFHVQEMLGNVYSKWPFAQIKKKKFNFFKFLFTTKEEENT